MKKITIACAVMLVAVLAYAGGTLATRSIVTLGTATGAATWTNPYEYGSIDLKRMTVYNGLAAADTVTVYRVTSDDTYTNTIGTIAVSSNIGTQTTLAYNYLQNGDKVVFSGAGSTGMTVMVEYEVNRK